MILKVENSMELTILFEDKHIIVCEKPAGVPSQSDRGQDMDMVSRIKNYLREKEPDLGVPYVAAVHRLDRPVGGIMVFAKTQKAAAGLSQQIQKGQMRKQYLAVICGDYSQELGKEPKELCDYLKKDGRTNLSVIASEKDKQAKKARLAYKVLEITREMGKAENSIEASENLSLLDIELFTGRHHQIRVQLSQNLAGIWGDTKYNAENCKGKGFQEIALYSWKLSFSHPITGKKMSFEKVPQKYPFHCFKVLQEA